MEVIAVATFNGCLSHAAQYSGKDDQDIADEIHICHGYMSRFMRGVAQQWAHRLVAFMRATNSLAPLQWMAHQFGRELVEAGAARSNETERLAKLEALVARLEEGRAA